MSIKPVEDKKKSSSLFLLSKDIINEKVASSRRLQTISLKRVEDLIFNVFFGPFSFNLNDKIIFFPVLLPQKCFKYLIWVTFHCIVGIEIDCFEGPP